MTIQRKHLGSMLGWRILPLSPNDLLGKEMLGLVSHWCIAWATLPGIKHLSFFNGAATGPLALLSADSPRGERLPLQQHANRWAGRGQGQGRDRCHACCPFCHPLVPEDGESPPTMKNPWLILAAILALVAAATETERRLHLEEIIFNRTDVLIMPALESSKLLEPQLDPRTRREAVAPRRGRLRAGPRPTCRGCYSGLMIVAPPIQGSKNASWAQSSHSESEGASSEGD